jgi:hypothetical protein
VTNQQLVGNALPAMKEALANVSARGRHDAVPWLRARSAELKQTMAVPRWLMIACGLLILGLSIAVVVLVLGRR